MIFSRLRALLGPAAVDRDADNVPRVAPGSTDALALVCRLAHDEGWKIRVEGLATWLPADAPADPHLRPARKEPLEAADSDFGLCMALVPALRRRGES